MTKKYYRVYNTEINKINSSNIVDKQDRISTCSIDLKLPGYELANTGIAITHGKLNDYVFYLRDNFLFNIRKYLKF